MIEKNNLKEAAKNVNTYNYSLLLQRVWGKGQVDFAVSAHNRGKFKGSDKRNKFLNLARVLKKILNMKEMVIPIEINSFLMVLKGMEWGLEDHPNARALTRILKSPEDLRRLVVIQNSMKR